VVMVGSAGNAGLVRPPPLTMGTSRDCLYGRSQHLFFLTIVRVERHKWAIWRRAPEARVVTTRTPKAGGIDGCLWRQPLALEVLEVVRLPDKLSQFLCPCLRCHHLYLLQSLIRLTVRLCQLILRQTSPCQRVW
jgi:hypothetical protein